jgi:adenosine kinase
MRHASEFAAQGIPFIFDPGQGLPMFDGEELRSLITMATALTVNDYEAKLLSDRTGWSEEDIAARLKALVITRGAEGSTLFEGGARQTITAASITRAVDPTGCGDAYRSGLLYGLSEGWSWLDSARLGSVLGAAKIEHAGAQNHPVDRAELGRALCSRVWPRALVTDSDRGRAADRPRGLGWLRWRARWPVPQTVRLARAESR